MDRRVRFFSANDLSIGFYLDRVEQVLSDPSYKPTLTIHDAIELYECYRFMTSGIRANRWDDDWYTELRAASEIAKSVACKRMREIVANDDKVDQVLRLNLQLFPLTQKIEGVGDEK